MALVHCISHAIYVKVLFIIKIVLCYTTDILPKNTCPNPTLNLFLNYSYFWGIISLSVLIKLFL